MATATPVSVPRYRHNRGALLAALAQAARDDDLYFHWLPTLGPQQMITAYVRHNTFTAGVLSTEPGMRVQRIGSRRGDSLGQFAGPVCLCQLPNGDLVVSEQDNSRVQVLSAPEYATANARVLGGPRMTLPAGVACNVDGNIVIGQWTEPRMCVVTPAGMLVRTLEITDLLPLQSPTRVAVSSDGQCIVTDGGNDRVRLFDATNGAYVRDFAPQGTANGQMLKPRGVCVTADDDVLFVDYALRCVHQFRLDGTFMRRIGSPAERDGLLILPVDIAVDARNSIIVSDKTANRIQMLRSDGVFVRTVAAQPDIRGPAGVCVLSNGHVALCDYYNDCVDIWT
jgi:DNA-binding beta-propeller fold protein YncE